MSYTSSHLPPEFHFDEFKLKAKIDFITIGLPTSLKTPLDGYHFLSAIRGRVHTAKRWRDSRDNWITIHDPHRDDLQYLLDNYPETEILALEIAVDFFLRDRTNNPERLRSAHNYFTVNLFPQGHKRFASGAKRKIYTDDGKIRLDTMKTGSGGKSVYWGNRDGFEQVRLYVKTRDNKKPIDHHSTRLEITLNRGGCQKASVDRVCLLPGFSKRVRRYLSPFLKVAEGIKPDKIRTRAKNPDRVAKVVRVNDRERKKADRNFIKYGAESAARNHKRIFINRQASEAIGASLKGLREQLADLKLPEKSADLLDRWGPESPMYKGISRIHAPEL